MKTQRIGEKTRKKVERVSPLNVLNKDPRFDYSFRRKSEIEDAGGEDMYGWGPVKTGNCSDEVLDNPLARFRKTEQKTKTKTRKEMKYLDVVLCRRPKEVSEYFRAQENEKYNANVRFIKSVSKNAKESFRDSGVEVSMNDTSKYQGPSVEQRLGTTEEKVQQEAE